MGKIRADGMKKILRHDLTLLLICVIASIFLSGVNFVIKSRFAGQAKMDEISSLKEVMPEAERFVEVKSGEKIVYYKAYAKDGELIGAAFKASGKGYSSTIETLVGMKKEGEITAVKVLSQNESIGLGARVVGPAFIGQFSHKSIQKLSEVQGLTGATISSKAVIDSIAKKAQEIKEIIRSEQ